jgi:hypothetical protein
LDVENELKSQLFFNSKINRKLNKKSVQYFLDEMNEKNKAEWTDKVLYFLYFRTKICV